MTINDTNLDKTEQEFTRNIDFKNTNLSAVSTEYFKKRMQFSVALMNPSKTTENLEAYLDELSLYRESNRNNEVLDTMIQKDTSDLEETMKIWKLLMGITAIMFLIFGLSALLTRNTQLGIIALVDLAIFTIAFYNCNKYKKIKEYK